MEDTDSDPRRANDDESEAASGAAASSSARPRTSRRVTSATNAKPNDQTKRKRQSTLAAVVLPRREDVTVLAGAKPSSGSGTGSAVRSGTRGRKKDWIHEHWAPVDTDKYKADDPTTEARAFKDNAWMRCLHCDKQRRFQPSTKFKDHLVVACPAFADSDSWEDPDVQQELERRKSKVCGKISWQACVCTLASAASTGSDANSISA